MSGTSLTPIGAPRGEVAPSGKRLDRRGPPLPVSVLEFHSPSAGMMNAPVMPGARYTVWMVSSLVIACGLAAGLIPIDKVVTASGKVISVAPTEVVQPLETAIVRSIDVQEGQVVHKGQILARLDPTFASADAGATTQQMQSLQAEVDRLTAEANGQPYQPTGNDQSTQVQAAIFAQRASERNFRLQNYQQKIDGYQALALKDQQDAEFYKQRLAIATNVAGMRAELQRDQVGSKLNTLQAQDTQVEATRALSASLRSAQQDRSQLQAEIADRDAYDQQWRSKVSQELTDASRKLADAREQYAKAALRQQLVELRADQDGVVQTIAKVSVGSVLASGDQFFTLVPLNSPLEIEANIPASESGYVQVGDKVNVKFATFASTRYGGADGIVRLISPDSFTANNPDGNKLHGAGANAQGAGGGDTFYRARITMDRITLHDTPAPFHVVPGMPVAADINVGKRTVLGYLIGSVAPVAAEGMREP